MPQPTSLHIASPCHQNWSSMNDTQTGKFCTSCRQSVVDFTLMSDTQILQFLAKHKGKLCGRFDAEQLARPLIEPIVHKKRSLYFAILLPFSLLFQKGFGQTGKRTMVKPAMRIEHKPVIITDVVLGTPFMIKPDWVTLHGTLTDEKGNMVANASIVKKGTSYGTVTDSSGRFVLQLHNNEDSIELVASSVGYSTLEKKVDVNEAGTEIHLMLIASQAMLGDVIVTSNITRNYVSMMGGISVCRRITHVEKTDSLVRKILRLNTFVVYPNPAHSGSTVQINIKKKGDYELQLLSNSSSLLKMEEMHTNSENANVSFQLSSNLTAGIYYLRLTNSKDKTSYLEKILVN